IEDRQQGREREFGLPRFSGWCDVQRQRVERIVVDLVEAGHPELPCAERDAEEAPLHRQQPLAGRDGKYSKISEAPRRGRSDDLLPGAKIESAMNAEDRTGRPRLAALWANGQLALAAPAGIALFRL